MVKESFSPKKFFTKDNIQFLIWMITLMLITLFVNITIVSGISMYPTFNDRDVLLMEKASVKFDKLDREDVISFRENLGEKQVFFIKRIIGLPGETVEIKNGRVYINDILLQEDFLDNSVLTNLPDGQEALKVTLKKDEYFVLGDNRDNSIDSRYESVGVVPKEDIVSRKLIRIIGF